MLVSIVSSLLLPNYYQASAIFYVASPDQAMPNNIGEKEKEKRFFGNDSDIDRFLAIGNSSALKQEMIKQFNLYEHYEIDSTRLRAASKVMKRFESNYSLTKNKFDALELSIEDQNPKQVADMVNHCRFLIEQKTVAMIKNKQKEQLQNIQKNVLEFEQEVERLGAELEAIQTKFEIYNAETQSESLSKILAEQMAEKFSLEASSPNSSKLRSLDKSIQQTLSLLNSYAQGFPKLEKTLTEHIEATNQLVKEQERYKQLKAIYDADVPVTIIVENGQQPDVKSRPKRSLIVLAATLFGFLLTVIGVLLFHQYQQMDWEYIKRKD